MGRQAKFKKMRKQADSQTPAQFPEYLDSTQFVQQLTQEGYSIHQAQRSPELPSPRVNPQV